MPISLFRKSKRKPAEILEEGWQLYAKPTTLEPVGTIFRIDDKRRRFMVDKVTIEVQEGAEVVAKVQQSVKTNIGFFARFLGLDSYRGKINAKNIEKLDFEIVDPVRQSTFDTALDRALTPVLKELKYRVDNRYYIIRERISATAMVYRLTQAQLGDIGGEASLSVALNLKAGIDAGRGGVYEINQIFPERMGVMFLAEEIAPVKAGLSGDQPELGRLPIRHTLLWIEG